MKSIQLFILIFFSGLQLVSAQIRTEILSCPTNTGISIKAVFDTVVDVKVFYGTVSGTYTSQTQWTTFSMDSTDEAVALVNLANLIADTKYFYRLKYRKSGTTAVITRPEFSFHTARPAGEPFTFVIEADPHLDAASDTALYHLCLKNQLEDNPDFMIDLGDNFMTDKLNNPLTHQVPRDTIPYRCKLLRSFYEIIGHSVPIFLVLGNHEGEAGWYLNGTANNVAVWDTKYRKKYYSNPEPNGFYTGDTTNYPFIGKRQAYYSWSWGDALFIVLDPYWGTNPKPDSLNCWRWTLGAAQYNWLKTTLENSQSPNKFVFIHHLVGGGGRGEGRGGSEWAPFYEWGGKNLDGTEGWAAHRPGWYKPIKDLLEENKVSIVFHGHDHFYAEQPLNCVIYQEAPQPSLPVFNNSQAANFGYTHGVLNFNSGHLRVNVSPTGTTVEYVRAVKPSQETANLNNKDISNTYSINTVNCYDTLNLGITSHNSGGNSPVILYPNPVSNESVIKYSLSEANKVQIKIFDMLGNEISTIVNEHQEAGIHTIPINSEALSLSDGVYYCRIAIGKTVRNQKIIRLK